MPAELKFCGVTRAADAAEAAHLGADFVGVVFAGGPRRIDAASAAECLAPVPREVARVGVFGPQTADEIAEIAAVASLDVAQLHGDPDASAVERVRTRTGLVVWSVVRVEGSRIPAALPELIDAADAIVLDAKIAGALGGTGRSFDWRRVADALAPMRARMRIVLAGGLTPENVVSAIDTMHPDVVDVSSGVESAPGVKDHARMRAFSDAVRHAGANR